jgi:sugar lactone lactonase YvrE
MSARFRMLHWIAPGPALLLSATPFFGKTITVTSAGDSGAGTLRQAILERVGLMVVNGCGILRCLVAVACLSVVTTGTASIHDNDLFASVNGSPQNGAGSLYQYTPGGTKTVFASGFDEPRGLVFDTAGNLFMATNTRDASNHFHGTILKLTTESTLATGFPTDFFLEGLAIDSAGNLYVVANNNNDPNLASTIFEISPSGGISTFGSIPGQGTGVAFDSTGNLFVASASPQSNIYKFSPGGTRTVFVGPTAFTTVQEPVGLAFDEAGNLFVSTYGNYGNSGEDSILKFTPAGTASTFMTGLLSPRGLAFDSAGNLFVAELPPDASGAILKFTAAGAETPFANGIGPATGSGGPEFLAFPPCINNVVTNNSDSGPGSLRDVIAGACFGATITFAPGLVSPINLTSGELLIDKNLTISGPGANVLSVQRSTAGGTPQFRVFDIFSGNVTISGLSIVNGSPGSGFGGGGIYSQGKLTIAACAISGNTAGAGGGIANDTPGTVNVTNSNISGNTAGTGGGISSFGIATITNSSISGNTAGGGGGIYNVPNGNASSTLTITNSTVSGNTATQSGGLGKDGGGIYNTSTVTAKNTIIAKNAGGAAPDFSGTLTSQGYNLIGNTTATTITGTTTGNRLNIDPKLGPLQDNGGPTFTQALLSGSPAIDGGGAGGPNTDQRGFTRPVDSPATPNASGGNGSDIGAYEVQADQLPGCGNTLVTNNNDSGAGSLRFIMANLCQGETITFASSVVSPINLTSGELLIDKPMTISGPGANLMTVQRSASASTNFRIFHITSGGSHTISSLTISKGNPSESGGGVANDIGNTLTVTGCAISGNFANLANVFNEMVPSPGGGISNGAGANTILNLANSIVSGNSSTGDGSGIYNSGRLNITNSTVSGNSTAGGAGGGIANAGTTNLTNVTVSNNSAKSGGGIFNSNNNGSTVNVRNSIIAQNTGTTNFPDFSGTLTSQGFNLIGNNSGATITPAQSSDQIGTPASPIDPLLGPLQNNGGPTPTMALLTGSRAIDKGGSGTDPITGNAVTEDQRGLLRPVDNAAISNANGGDGSDIGAFEVQAPTPTPTPTATPTATPILTPTPTPTPAQPTVLANISTRLLVGTGDNVLIGGFIVTGTQSKKVLIRAIGPSLPLAGVLADPTLELYQGTTLLESNDNWMDSPNKQAIIDSTIPPSNPLESAIVRSVPPGNYTAIERGVNNGTGIGVVEAYDLDTSANSKLANISTRGLVQTGDNVLFAGTIVVGQASQKVIIRALGPSTGVPGAMADPTLELHDGNGALLETNDNWVDSPNKQAIIDSTIPPPNNLESAIVRTLTPANYTAIVRGVNNTTGIAVVEVYALN